MRGELAKREDFVSSALIMSMFRGVQALHCEVEIEIDFRTRVIHLRTSLMEDLFSLSLDYMDVLNCVDEVFARLKFLRLQMHGELQTEI